MLGNGCSPCGCALSSLSGRAGRPPSFIFYRPALDPIMPEQKLSDLKAKTPAELLVLAEELEIEAAASLRKQDMMFAILKELADRDTEIIGSGVLEVLQDGFGFLRSSDEIGRAHV